MNLEFKKHGVVIWGGILIAGWALAASAAGTGTGTRQGPAARIPISVRVTDGGGAFVSDLTLKDFEILEAGSSFEPEALFLVRKNAIERQEGAADVRPDVSRTIVLLFQLNEHHNKIPEALDFFFKEEILPGDTLEIQTPMKNYRMTPEALSKKSPAELAKALAGIVRKDIVQGGMAYNSALRDLRRLVVQISSSGAGLRGIEGEEDDGQGLEQLLSQYSTNLQKMETLRAMDEGKLLGFAGSMKSRPGQKSVFYVYQREFRPEISSQAVDRIMSLNQDRPNVIADVQTLFQLYSRAVRLDRDRLRQAFADSGMTFHFLFMNRQPEKISGIVMREQSDDFYKALSAAAEATGGVSDTSQNPAASIRSTMRASEAYYLLYYTPKAAVPRGTFLDLTVKVKGRDYKVTHRAGYFSGL
jgi:hypothetical protein